jgi:RNA polymerase sigma-70 factor (ECF subfamily)
LKKNNLFIKGEKQSEDLSQLVLAAQAGSKEAFVRLFEKVKDSLYRTACVILENESDAYDALQDVALKAYKNIKQLREPLFFKTWVTRILINKCCAILKERKKVSLLADMSVLQVNLRENSPFSVGVMEAVNRLSFPYRAVIVLRYLEGYSQKEIARILKCPVGTVKSRLNAALKKLKADLEVQGLWHPSKEEEAYEL